MLRLVKTTYCLRWTVASCGDNSCGRGDTFTTAIIIRSDLLVLLISRCSFRGLIVSWLLSSAASWLITLLEGWSARWPSWWSPPVGTASPLRHIPFRGQMLSSGDARPPARSWRDGYQDAINANRFVARLESDSNDSLGCAKQMQPGTSPTELMPLS